MWAWKFRLRLFPIWVVLAGTCAWASPVHAQESVPKEVGGSGAAGSRSDALTFANGLLRQRKFELAAEEYERILNAGATGSERDDARFGLGSARLSMGRYREARQAFDDFLKGAPADPRVLSARYRLGELSYLLGDLPRARQALEAFTGSKVNHPSLESAWTYLGDTCFGLEDLRGARAAYEQSITAYPNGRTADRARYGLARSLAVSGEGDRAIAILQELAKKGAPDWVDRSWLQIGLIRETGGRFAEAVDAFSTLERVATGSPLRAEAQFHRGLALARLDRVAETEELLGPLAANGGETIGPRAALELATFQLEHKRAEAALATLEAALNRYPRCAAVPALQFRTAEALQQQKRPADAEARFLKVAADFPDDAWADDALQRAAQAALERGDFGATRRLAATFAARYGQSPLRNEVRVIEARAASLSGNPKDTVAILEPLVGSAADRTKTAGSPKAGRADGGPAKGGAPLLAPSVALAARYDLALAYRALGQSARADAILETLAKEKAGPVTTDAQFLVGQSHLDAGRYADAVASLEQYLAANPHGDVAEYAMAHLVMARVGLGQINAAWEMLGKLAKAFPESKSLPPARLRAAEAALGAHQAERAAEQFRLIVPPLKKAGQEKAQDPTDRPTDAETTALRVRAYSGLGRALTDLNKPAEAAEAFAAIIGLAPDNPIAPEIALARAGVLEGGHQIEAALKAYSFVLDRYPKSDEAARAGLARARLLGKAGRYGEAASDFERLSGDLLARDSLKAAGATPEALLAEWGWSLLDAERPAEADRVFGQLLKQYPDSPFAADARFNLAESANAQHNYAEVIRLLTPLAALETGAAKNGREGADSLGRLLPAVLYRLGRTHVELKDWAAAIGALDRLLKEFPENSFRREACYLRAESALQDGDAAAAESGFSALLAEPAAATDPKGFIPTIRLKRIRSRIALKRWKEALDDVQSMRAELQRGDPAAADLDFATGQALVGLARLEEARTAFQRVIDASGKGDLAARALLMHGEAYFHQDKLHEALRDFLKVDILYDAPRWQAAALLEAGKVYERLDQWADAAETYGRLLAKFPREAPASEAGPRRAAASSRAALNGSARKS
jgi:TolA-binding protein